MAYKINDWVVHPQHGVGQIVKLVSRQFGSGTPQKYYEISIPDGTIWVQVEGSTCGLRKLTAKGEMTKYRELLKSRPKPLTENHRQRQIEIADRLRQGTFQSRCEVVRDLTALGWNKPLGEGNTTLLRATHKALFEEWAMVREVSISEATREVDALLQEGRHKYNK